MRQRPVAEDGAWAAGHIELNGVGRILSGSVKAGAGVGCAPYGDSPQSCKGKPGAYWPSPSTALRRNATATPVQPLFRGRARAMLTVSAHPAERRSISLFSSFLRIRKRKIRTPFVRQSALLPPHQSGRIYLAFMCGERRHGKPIFSGCFGGDTVEKASTGPAPSAYTVPGGAEGRQSSLPRRPGAGCRRGRKLPDSGRRKFSAVQAVCAAAV